jgi:hypothetical protein
VDFPLFTSCMIVSVHAMLSTYLMRCYSVHILHAMTTCRTPESCFHVLVMHVILFRWHFERIRHHDNYLIIRRLRTPKVLFTIATGRSRKSTQWRSHDADDSTLDELILSVRPSFAGSRVGNPASPTCGQYFGFPCCTTSRRVVKPFRCS